MEVARFCQRGLNRLFKQSMHTDVFSPRPLWERGLAQRGGEGATQSTQRRPPPYFSFIGSPLTASHASLLASATA